MKWTVVAQSCAIGALLLYVSPAVAQCLLGPNGDLIQSNGAPCANTIITATPFLSIVPDARFGALGNAGIALSPDPNSLHLNASYLAFAENRFGISANFVPWLRALGLNDVFLASASAYLGINNKAGKKLKDSRMQTLAMGARFFSLGQIQYSNAQGTMQMVVPNEFELNFAYARKLGKRFSAALATKYIYSYLGKGIGVTTVMRPAHAFAADLSFTYRQPLRIGSTTGLLAIGLALNNLGSKIGYTKFPIKDYLPANFGIGTAFEYHFDKRNSITIALDINKLMTPSPIFTTLPNGNINPDYDKNGDGIADYEQYSVPASWFVSFADSPEGIKGEFQELMVSLGLEYWYNKLVAVRLGYYYENKHKGARQYLTAGLGLRYKFVGFNASYIFPSFGPERSPLDNTFRFSLLFEFMRLRK